MRTLLTLISIATCIVSGWMASMYLVLRHPAYLERAGVAGLVLVGAALAATHVWHGSPVVRGALGVWAATLALLGLWALVGTATDDGWVIIAGLVFLVEGGLTLAMIWMDWNASSIRRTA